MKIIYIILLFFELYGDWGLGIVDCGLGPIPNTKSPLPKPPSPIPQYYSFKI